MSWCNIHTMLCFIVISRSFQSAPVTRRTLFYRLPDLDDRLVHNFSVVRVSPDVWDCARICFAESICMSVAFVPMSKACVIYERSVSATDNFTIFNSTTVHSVCPSGFSVVSRRCIKVVTDTLDWNSAREHCRDHGADLITLESQARISKFRDFMLANGYANNHFWCGAVRVHGGWQWINAKTFSSNSDLWCSNQPSSGQQENCTVIIKHVFNCFHDDRCNSRHPFVCEMQI